jgi:hypothetical protein
MNSNIKEEAQVQAKWYNINKNQLKENITKKAQSNPHKIIKLQIIIKNRFKSMMISKNFQI